MKRYLIKADIPDTAYKKGRVLLVHYGSDVAMQTVFRLGDMLKMLDTVEKPRYTRQFMGVDPIVERRKWAKYHKNKKKKS